MSSDSSTTHQTITVDTSTLTAAIHRVTEDQELTLSSAQRTRNLAEMHRNSAANAGPNYAANGAAALSRNMP